MFLPNISDIKILVTIEYLNSKNKYPTHEGVLKILKGVVDEETISLRDCPTFQTLLSFNSKQISRHIMMLLRYNYLSKIYDSNTNELYLLLSDKGKAFLVEYFKKHHPNFKRKIKKEKITIVEILK